VAEKPLGKCPVVNVQNQAISGLSGNLSYKGKRAYEPFISHWSKKMPADDPEAYKISKPGKESVKFLFWTTKLPNFISHSL
jgi:hypothetical protein